MIPIVMTAVGTTADALAAYDSIEEAIRAGYPGEEIHRAYTSRRVTRVLRERQRPSPPHLEEVLGDLAGRGVRRVVVQSLHLFPGGEFHHLAAAARSSGLECAVGLPLLTTPDDYRRVGEILAGVVEDRPGQAILVLGHGTAHPTWVAYYALEKILRRRFGDRLFVGVVEKFPDSSHLPDEIAEAGFTEALIIPLFLVCGVHVRRDIIGDPSSPSSWMARLHARNISPTCFNHGLGSLPGLSELVVSHITAAREKFFPPR